MSFSVHRGFRVAILLVCLGLLDPVRAVEYPAEFPISDAQMSAVGVELVQVQKLVSAVAPHFPA